MKVDVTILKKTTETVEVEPGGIIRQVWSLWKESIGLSQGCFVDYDRKREVFFWSEWVPDYHSGYYDVLRDVTPDEFTMNKSFESIYNFTQALKII